MKHLQQWDSIYDAVDHLLNHEFDMTDDERASLRKDGRDKWYGSKNFGDAIKLAREGWPEAADTAMSLVRQVLDSSDVVRLIEERVPHRIADVAGGRVAVGRYLVGDPRSMVRRKRMRGERTRKVIRVLVMMSLSVGTDDRVVKQGAAIAAFIDVLTTIGYSVELAVELSGDSMDHRHEIGDIVTLKHADEPLDLRAIMFGLSHLSMFRRIAFALWETRDAEVRQSFGVPGGYALHGKRECRFAEEWGADLALALGNGWLGNTGPEWIREQVEALVG